MHVDKKWLIATIGLVALLFAIVWPILVGAFYATAIIVLACIFIWVIFKLRSAWKE